MMGLKSRNTQPKQTKQNWFIMMGLISIMEKMSQIRSLFRYFSDLVIMRFYLKMNS